MKINNITGLCISTVALALVLISPAYAWTNLEGGDHGGANWIPANGAVISGTHTNVGNFIVDCGRTVTINPYNPSVPVQSTYGGRLTVIAQNIQIQGTLDASGAGYGGGGGGGGGVGSTGPKEATDADGPHNNYLCNDNEHCQPYTKGNPGAGARGAQNGTEGSKHCANEGTSYGGKGGNGLGTYAGTGGAATEVKGKDTTTSNYRKNGIAGTKGGYATTGGQGDASVDDTVLMGSGGGGGSGGAASMEMMHSSIGGSGGGGAGGSGGGAVRLFAAKNLEVSSIGKILTSGKGGGNGGQGDDGFRAAFPNGHCDLQGSGGAGGNANTAESSAGAAGVTGHFVYGAYNSCIARYCNTMTSTGRPGAIGGAGGSGAGGGVLLRGASVCVEGVVDARASDAGTGNGGTVKIKAHYPASITGTVASGRLYSTSWTAPSLVGVARCSGPSVDAGIRYRATATRTVKLAAESGTLSSPIRVIAKKSTGANTVVGLKLTDSCDPLRSNIGVMTINGVRYVKTMP